MASCVIKNTILADHVKKILFHGTKVTAGGNGFRKHAAKHATHAPGSPTRKTDCIAMSCFLHFPDVPARGRMPRCIMRFVPAIVSPFHLSFLCHMQSRQRSPRARARSGASFSAKTASSSIAVLQGTLPPDHACMSGGAFCGSPRYLLHAEDIVKPLQEAARVKVQKLNLGSKYVHVHNNSFKRPFSALIYPSVHEEPR